MERIAVFIDLSTIRIGANIFEKIYSDLRLRGSIEYIKLYNYNTKRHREFRSIVSKYNIPIELPLTGKKRVRIDMRQVIDIVDIAASCHNITTFFLICSEVDGVHVIDYLKKMGKNIIIGTTSPSTLSDKAHETYLIDRGEEVKEEDVPCDMSDAVVTSMDNSKKIGDASNIFPFSDVDSREISERMAEIDRRILHAIGRNNMNIDKIFGDK